MNSKLKLKFKTNCVAIIMFTILLLLNTKNIMEFHVVNASAQNFTYIYRDYLRNMMSITDLKVQPCDEFFQHACGNFQKFQNFQTQPASSESVYPTAEQDVIPYLYNKQDNYMFFETHKQYFNTVPGILIAELYDQCKHTQKHNTSNSRRKLWLKMLKEIPFLKQDYDLLRKWPFLQYQWEKYNQQLDLNWPALAGEFSAHGLNTFIKVYFAENTLYVTPNDDLRCLASELDIKTSILTLLRQRNPQIADVISGELWLLCRQLKGEIDFSAEIVNNSTKFLEDGAIMLGFFQRLFNRLNISELSIVSARKVFIHIDEVNDMISLLQLTNPRIVYNFILWQAYQQNTNIDDDCFDLMQEFQDLLDVEYWHWHAFRPHFSRSVALASYLFHTTRFQQHYRQFILSSSWERLFQNRAERKDLNIERSIKNYAKQYLDLVAYTDTFKTDLLNESAATFYSRLFEIRSLKLRYSYLYPSAAHSDDLNFFKEFLNFSILLLYRPRLHYFASYDREFWENSKILQNSDGLYTALDCLEQQTADDALNADDSDVYENLRTMEQVNEIFNFYNAFIESLKDYKFWLESENFAIAEDFILEYFKLNSTRVLFYAVAQQFCNRNDDLYRNLINRSYMNMPEFQEAFNCLPDDQMNAITKCMIKQCL